MAKFTDPWSQVAERTKDFLTRDTESICTLPLIDFVKEAWGQVEMVPFIPNWHIEAICEHLQAVTTGQIPKLLINIPPGCSKSLLVSVFWPTWEWSRNPSIRWFYASYDQRLSTRDSVKCRALINSQWYQSLWGRGYELTSDDKTNITTSKGGYRMATSVGGHAAGEHPDRIAIDDAHNIREAESEIERQNVLDWWDLSLSSRGVSRDARRVIIMQRLHHGDLSGHVLKQNDWVHLCLPMRYEPGRMATTPLGFNDPRTIEGELLTPIQFDEPKVAELEKSLGAYGTAGQLQQRPVPKSGGMFKEHWFDRRERAAPYVARRVRYWDKAASKKTTSCFTVGVLMAKDKESNYWIENVVRGQWNPDERDAIILATAKKDSARYGPTRSPKIVVEQEPGSSGIDSFRFIPDRSPPLFTTKCAWTQNFLFVTSRMISLIRFVIARSG
jgi:hypothetical protein